MLKTIDTMQIIDNTSGKKKLKFIKILFATIYLLLIILFLFFYFIFDLKQYFNLEYLIENKEMIFLLKEENIILLSVIFFVFVIIWILLQGFGSPLTFLAGFIFGTYLGSLLVITAATIGCTLVYIISKTFFKEIIYDKYSKHHSKFINNFNKNEFLYFMILRFIPAIPIQVLNFLPVIFNMKIKNFFLATLVGTTIPKIIYVNLASSLATSIKNNPLNINIFFSKGIIFALLILIVFIIIANYFKKKYYKNHKFF